MTASKIIAQLEVIKNRQPNPKVKDRCDKAIDAILGVCERDNKQPKPGSIDYGLISKNENTELSDHRIALALINLAK